MRSVGELRHLGHYLQAAALVLIFAHVAAAEVVPRNLVHPDARVRAETEQALGESLAPADLPALAASLEDAASPAMREALRRIVYRVHLRAAVRAQADPSFRGGGYLGVRAMATPNVANVSPVVAGLPPGFPASGVLWVNDVLLGLAAPGQPMEPIRSFRDLQRLVQNRLPGDEGRLLVLRGGRLDPLPDADGFEPTTGVLLPTHQARARRTAAAAWEEQFAPHFGP